MQINGIIVNEIQTWTGLCKFGYAAIFDTASVNSVGISNKNAINLRRKIFIIINFPCSNAFCAKLFCTIFSIWRDFLFTQCREKYYPRSPIEIANSSRPVFLWRFVWKRAAPIRWFDFALCCIKRIVRYYPCGELTLTIFFFLNSGQGNVISTKVVCKNSRICNKLVFVKYLLNKRYVILHSLKILE